MAEAHRSNSVCRGRLKQAGRQAGIVIMQAFTGSAPLYGAGLGAHRCTALDWVGRDSRRTMWLG